MPGKFKPANPLRLPTIQGTTLEQSLLQPRKQDNSTVSVPLSSQHTNFEYFGDNDITDLIIALEHTQPEDEKSDSNTSSTSSLGKRKASDMSSTSSTSTLFPPSKIVRRTLVKDDEDNPFLENSKIEPEDPTSPICLSPSHVLQNLFTAKKLPYGAQYEINRLVSVGKLTYDDILVEDVDKLAKLGTNREAAPATAKLMLMHKFEDDVLNEFENLFAKERAAKSPWEEFDREEEALQKSPYGALGFDENKEPLGWYGGQVLFHAKLHDASRDRKSRTMQYKLTLEPAELSSSHSFARRFGSKHFLRLKLTKAVLNKNSKQLLDYIRRPLILCGSVFRAFFAKESNVFYVKTNEGTNGKSILPNVSIPNVMSFLEFINWHNPIELNSKQTMAKYSSRFALGLSNSVPGIMVDMSNLQFIDDIISPETRSNMTDGAGKTNRWTLKQLRHRIEWEDKPTAIQTRVFGSKGLLVEDIKNADEFSYVELTPSQQKIVYPSGVSPDPAHCIIDVLRSSHAKSPCRLSVETIINLSENGVPKTVFLDLLCQGLKELVEPLLEWEGPDSMRNLWCNMRRCGGVMSARRAREDAGLARVKGYSEYDLEEIELDDEDGFKLIDTNEQRSSAWWRDEISGCPSSLEETVMCLIDSGFTPQNCPVLRSKLEKVVKGYVKNYIKSYRIDVPMSASAFIIPDTLGILEPGEIFFKHSKNKFRTLDGLGTDVLLGVVLVTRHPCKLPTDIQKWKAVDKPELHHLIDVVVLSTKGSRRAADLLSGGDYDGDKGLVIFQPEVVEAFKESPLHYSEPPSDIKSYFKRENEEVVAFLARVASLDDTSKIYKLQEYLLGAIRDVSVVGKYSNFHETAIYTLGYTHKETIRLAYMFCMTLDGFKTGMTVREEILKKDTKIYQKRPPKWKETEEERERFCASGQNENNLQRPNFLGQFIMDELYKQAEVEGNRWLARIESHFQVPSRCKVDEDLVSPWNKAIELSNRWAEEENNTRMRRELEAISEHVKSVYTDHRASLASPNKASRNSPKKGAVFTGLPIELRQDTIRKLSKQFVSFPPPGKFLMQDEEIARLRASYAYKYDHEKRLSGWTRFPWDVAMRELGAIKARATGGHKTIAGEFYDHFNMKHSKNYHM